MSDRTVTTDALSSLGTIIGTNEKRDAIHLAVEPAVAAHTLRPGDHVGFIGTEAGSCSAPVGIVDPFLTHDVEKGERFWLVVYPRQITSLRHVWEHPGFPLSTAEAYVPPKDYGAAKSVLEYFAETVDLLWLNENTEERVSGYRVAIKALRSMAERGFVGFDAHGEIPATVWDAYEIVTGEKVSERPEWFSCGC